MYLSAAIPGGLTPGTYEGIARDLLTFVANFWPGTGHWTAFALPKQDTRERPVGFLTSPPSWKWKIRTAELGITVERIPNTGRSKCTFVEIVILWLTRYKAEPRCVQKTGGLTIFAHCIYHCWAFIKNCAGNYVTIWESFQIMLPWGGTVVAFCGRTLALGRWNKQMSWCKYPGVPRGQPLGMAADKCIIR